MYVCMCMAHLFSDKKLKKTQSKKEKLQMYALYNKGGISSGFSTPLYLFENQN